MAIEFIDVVKLAGVAAGSGLAGFFGSRRGAKRELNGTAETVREIKRAVDRHASKVDARFDDLMDEHIIPMREDIVRVTTMVEKNGDDARRRAS